MAAQVEYQVYKICRSDGADTGPGYWPAPADNGGTGAKGKKPVKDAPEKATRGKSQMFRLPENSDKFNEWRAKLGILLKQELSPTPNEGLPWLVQFPRGYWLYEKSNRTYVVSGYPNKAKLFKSPQEFGLHILWLMSNSEDRADCTCTHCNVAAPAPTRPSTAADEGVTARPSANKPSQAASSTLQTTTTAPTPSSIPWTPSSGVPKTSSAANALTAPSASSTPTPALAPSASPALPASTHSAKTTPTLQSSSSPAPPGQQQQQQQRPNPSSLLFRVGELIWYQTGTAWKLGLIVFSKPLVPSVPGTHQVLPIGIGMVSNPMVAKEDKDIRPFQAFSVPAVSRRELSSKSFDNTIWELVVQNWQEKMRASKTDAEKAAAQSLLEGTILDASKMAALKIHHSFSVFTKMLTKEGWTYYFGCFLGAERIELNDVLRVKTLAQHEKVANQYFCLKFIRTSDANPGIVQFHGHLVELVEGTDAREAISQQSIPWGLREELAWRNNIDPATPRKLVLLQGLSLKEAEVKGRFYPTHRLGPILTPEAFENAKAIKDPSSIYLPLNDRLASPPPPSSPYIGRKKTRLETAGKSVPHVTRFAFEPHVKEDSPDENSVPATS